MGEPPADLTNALLRACLRDQYGLTIAQLTYLPLGHDYSAWAFRAVAHDGRDYFLKVRARIVNEAGLLVPRALHDHGVAQVVAPLSTVAGSLWAAVGGYAAILYPFVAGGTGMARGMTDEQWAAYGALLRQVHEMVPPPGLAGVLRRESFAPDGGDVIRRLDDEIGERSFDDPDANATATFWRSRRAEIRRLLARAEALGQRLAQEDPPCVLCHADIHTNNVLVGDDGRVWFVDWDDTMLAPRERDLLFVVGGLRQGLVGPRDEAHFFAGYGATTVNRLALAYYRHARAVSDLAEDAAQVFFRPGLDPATRRGAGAAVARIFQPGYLVTLAFATDV